MKKLSACPVCHGLPIFLKILLVMILSVSMADRHTQWAYGEPWQIDLIMFVIISAIPK
jgi:hypothetical protein